MNPSDSLYSPMNEITQFCLSRMPNTTINPLFLASASAQKTLISKEEYNKIKLKSYMMEEDECIFIELLPNYIKQLDDLISDLMKLKEDHPVIRRLSGKRELAQLMLNKLKSNPKILPPKEKK